MFCCRGAASFCSILMNNLTAHHHRGGQARYDQHISSMSTCIFNFTRCIGAFLKRHRFAVVKLHRDSQSAQGKAGKPSLGHNMRRQADTETATNLYLLGWRPSLLGWRPLLLGRVSGWLKKGTSTDYHTFLECHSDLLVIGCFEARN